MMSDRRVFKSIWWMDLVDIYLLDRTYVCDIHKPYIKVVTRTFRICIFLFVRVIKR